MTNFTSKNKFHSGRPKDIRLTLLLLASFLALCSLGSWVYAQTESKKIESEVIALWPSGFEPGTLQRPVGKFLLAVDNRSGIEEIDLELNALVHGAKADRLAQRRSEKGTPDWSPLIDLPAGDYVLSEATHPDWVLYISIGKPKSNQDQ